MADTELLGRLRSVPLFEGLSDRELSDVLARARVVEHRASSEIVEEGHGAAGFHLILEGSATVVQRGEVRGTLGPGQYFGEISLIDGKPRSATIRANEAVRTLSLPAWNFSPLLDAHPSMARKLLVGLCQHLRAIESSAR
jgi:CRP-like cAMP-binding protein